MTRWAGSWFRFGRIGRSVTVAILRCLAIAPALLMFSPADAASQSKAGLPLAVRAATVKLSGARLVGSARVVNSERTAVRSSTGFLSIRPSSGDDLTGVARFSVSALSGGASTTVRFEGSVGAGALPVAPGRYVALVCLDVDSQLRTFLARRNCTAVRSISIAGHRGPSPALHTRITGGPPAVATTASVVFAFTSADPGRRFQCRLDGGPWMACGSPTRYAGLVDGPHTFSVRGVTPAGAHDRTSGQESWVTAMLAATPYMGWNTYYGVGGIFDEQTVLSVADALISRGLAKAGYRIVWLDFGWASGARDSQGRLTIDSQQWPHGLPWLTGWLHARGLQAGIYTDAGASGCDRQGVGSLGHYQQDANAFAAWGFDAVKLDFCGAGQEGLDPELQYTQFAQALTNNASRRPMLLNVDNFWVPGQIDGTRPSLADSAYSNYRWAQRIAQSWRTDTDIGFTRNIQFVNVLRNLDHDAAHPEAAGPGHWNDPDYLGPELGMSGEEAQAQLSMWAILAAPLILGSDPRALSPSSIAMLANPQVIAVDQDSLGVQGRAVMEQGAGQVWVKPLAGGGRAVALLNRGTTALRITTTPSAIGLPRAQAYRLQDLWNHTTHRITGAISTVVAPHSAVLYRVATTR